MTQIERHEVAGVICAVCPDPTRPGLVTCSPKCAVELAKRFAEYARHAHATR